MPYMIALAGNPNCGKTTLFNALTGSKQYVGNWPGVTVQKKVGKTKQGSSCIVDLPGIYSLSPYSMEEVVARDYIINDNPDAIIDIVDATNLQRNLYLTLQLLELDRPMVVALNMMDEVEKKGLKIDCKELERALGVPVFPISAKKGNNVAGLLKATERAAYKKTRTAFTVIYDNATQSAIDSILSILSKIADKDMPLRFLAGKVLEGDLNVIEKLSLSQSEQKILESIVVKYEKSSAYGDRETMLADARYRYIESVAERCLKRSANHDTFTVSEKIDRIVTGKVTAFPIFLLTMFLMFSFTFGPFGMYLSYKIEYFFKITLGSQVSSWFSEISAPDWCTSLINDAVIGGVSGILKFLPQIAILFFCLSFLEDIGYMARAAFVTDRLLKKIGLSGKSFIPMLMGFGCTTSAVMAARSLENERDRRITIILTPFMSCSARLSVYALFAGTFFKENQGAVIFFMYVLGAAVAIVSGLLFKKILFKGDPAPFVMELPPYRIPALKSLLLHVWEKCKDFLIKAGTLILAMGVVIWLLQNFSLGFKIAADPQDSILGSLGKALALYFAPLGFGTWQAAVALLAGLIAKESVVSTLSVLFASAGVSLSTALYSVFTPASALSFMTFTLLYMPCISAFAVIKRELNSTKWTLLSILLQLAAAYVVSFAVYSIANLFL